MTIKYPHLFSPITLGRTVFRNRYFSAPVGYEYLTSQKYPNGECNAFYERKAIGGAATVCVGSTAPDSKRGVVGQSGFYMDDPEALPPFYRLATSISRHGAVACVELQHAGSFARYAASRGNQIYGAIDSFDENGKLIPAMPEAVIEETIEAYADAAAFAKFCGFGMVMVHSGHGWLLSQFLQPQNNNRKDRWGGSLENRCRFPIAICDRIKQKCGRGFPLDIRISGSECYPGGYDIDEGVAIAKQLEGHVDMIHVSAGSHEVPEVFTVTHPSMFLPDGVNVKYAAEIKKHVKTPVAAVGALSDPALMEEIIASGKADVIYAARALLADPDMPKKARAGKSDDIRPCLRCFVCFSGITTKRQYRCAVNPEIGFEQNVRFELPAANPKKVLIAGGGVAGMQAALTAAQRGHSVTLAEKTGRLGGALRCEENVPFKQKLRDYLDYQERTILRSPVDVRLHTQVDAAFVESVGADVIIAALGARPFKPKIKGIDGKNVMGAEQAYRHPEKTGKKIVILGGGLVGIELAVYLAGLGRGITILEMMNCLSDGDNPIHALALSNEIKKYEIGVSTSIKAAEITENGVVGEYAGDDYSLPPCPTVGKAVLQSNSFGLSIRSAAELGSRTLFEADTVIYAVGQSPLHSEAEALRFCVPEFHQIGDCLTPKNIHEATSTAFTIARDIGSF